ncbi:MAG: hypothetical protein HKN68_22950 [Saprospiraceae bacterium]|nr:hypothetical protein [Saprospiraceae bacterium]
MKFNLLLCVLLVTCTFIACNHKPENIKAVDVLSEEKALPENVHKVEVQEVLQVNNYTYLEVIDETKSKYWIAVPRREVEKGGTYYFSGGMMMENFKSKDLDREFSELILVDGIHATPTSKPIISSNTMPTAHEFEIKPEDVALVEGGVTIEELFKNPLEFKGKTILVKGMCVKMNRDIMDRNWLHIQDGTKDENGVLYDLTITTSDDVEPGNIVTLEGSITLNKDFGAGYVYPVIMEEGKIQ